MAACSNGPRMSFRFGYEGGGLACGNYLVRVVKNDEDGDFSLRRGKSRTGFQLTVQWPVGNCFLCLSHWDHKYDS